MIKNKETIKIYYDNDKNNIELRELNIELDQSKRYIKTFKDIIYLDINVVEINNEDDIYENYFLLPEINNIYYEKLNGRRINIFQYPNGKKLQVSDGYIKKIDKNEIFSFSQYSKWFIGKSCIFNKWNKSNRNT